MISLKLEDRVGRWWTAWRFQIFLAATHLLLFFHDILYTHILQLLHKKLFCVAQNTSLRQRKNITLQILWFTKNMLWQQKKLCDNQTRDPCWLNMFSVRRKRIHIDKKRLIWIYVVLIKNVLCLTKNTLMSCKN